MSILVDLLTILPALGVAVEDRDRRYEVCFHRGMVNRDSTLVAATD